MEEVRFSGILEGPSPAGWGGARGLEGAQQRLRGGQRGVDTEVGSICEKGAGKWASPSTAGPWRLAWNRGFTQKLRRRLEIRAQGLPGSDFILSRPFYSGRGFQNKANQMQTQAPASHTAAPPGESMYVVMVIGMREAI